MELAPQQAQAVDLVAAWLKDRGKQTFYLAGFAGTGKTTIAKHLAGLQKGGHTFLAYTGKAASVLRRKGCDANTIHSAVYRPMKPDFEAIKQAKEDIQKAVGSLNVEVAKERLRNLYKPKFAINHDSFLQELDLIIVDEVSMVNEQIGHDLLSFGVKILVLGDPGQLPPVGGEGYFTKGTPDFLLTEIHRQAADSPVIKLATLVRQGFRVSPGRYGDSIVLERNVRSLEGLIGADQVIVGRNRTRGEFNSLIRDKKEFVGVVPFEGEKVICLRNNKELGLLNGTQWTVIEAKDNGVFFALKILPQDEVMDKPLEVSCHPFGTDLQDFSDHGRRSYEEFDFGYAITCHKSQGSQWRNVFVQNESYCFRDDAKKWLYTAITRAEERVVIGN